MQKSKIKTIEVQTGVNPKFLENTLTEDISPLASLFDLIDNSIDAARDHLFQGNPVKDEYGLPANYSGYKIHLRVDRDSIRISDNCLGINETTLSERTIAVANRSNHEFGIGYYGLGLKRALLKFGSKYAMSTDTGEQAYKMRFDNNNFGGKSSSKLSADEYMTSGKRKTLFSVSDLKPEIKYEINSPIWFDNAINELSIRYAVYIAKGLEITIRSIVHHKHIKIDATLPSLREDGNFPPFKNPIIKIDEVDIYINSGIHEEYFFPGEVKHSISKNRLLTKNYGLYFICNDRVIVASSLAREHGWTATWHSEYNGFVCLVRFVSKDSKSMPWNTAKTAIRTDSTIFLKVRDQLQPIADQYRADIKRRYPKKRAGQDAIVVQGDKKTAGTSNSTNPSSTQGAKNAKSTSAATSSSSATGAHAANNPDLHVKNWLTLLPGNFPHSDDSFLNSLIIEAVDFKMADFPYASAMLYRAIIEASLKRFIDKSGNYKNVKEHFYLSTEGKKKNHTEAQKKAQGINPPMIIPWLVDNQNIFDSALRSRLIESLKKLKSHVPFLNGVVHGTQLMNSQRIVSIRDDTIDIVGFLATKDVTPL